MERWLIRLFFWIIYFANSLIGNKYRKSSKDQRNILNHRNLFLLLQKRRVKNTATVGLTCWASAGENCWETPLEDLVKSITAKKWHFSKEDSKMIKGKSLLPKLLKPALTKGGFKFYSLFFFFLMHVCNNFQIFINTSFWSSKYWAAPCLCFGMKWEENEEKVGLTSGSLDLVEAKMRDCDPVLRCSTGCLYEMLIWKPSLFKEVFLWTDIDDVDNEVNCHCHLCQSNQI